MRYLPGLDGLRALAVLLVVAHHSAAPWAWGGFIGVDVFFVLSGYLITRLLAETSPTLREFYIRRLMRLTPPLALMLAAYMAVFPFIRPDIPNGAHAGLAMLYLADYGKAYLDMPDYIGHTWSLSVEEHFYLLWPLVFFRFRPSVKVLLWAYIAATAWRYGMPWGSGYYRFDTRTSGLILGCLIATFPRDRFPAWPALFGLAFFGWHMRWHETWTYGPGLMGIELLAAAAILGEAPAWLKATPLAYLGKLSYGIYLWHYPIARLMGDAGYGWQATLAVTLPSSIALAALSYHTIEAWLRRRRLVRVSTGQQGSQAPAVSGVAE